MKSVNASAGSPAEGLRQQDRAKTSLTLEILAPHEDGVTFSAALLNLCHAGLGLRLDRRVELMVLWAGQTGSSHAIDVRFGLPVGDSLVPVEARCRVVWSKNVEEGRSCMGLDVLEFKGNGQATVDQYLAARLP